MALFRRKPTAPATPAPVANTTASASSGLMPDGGAGVAMTSAASSGTALLGTGPFDSANVPEIGTRVDLGALRVPVIPGMQVRMELDRATQQITGVTVMVQQPQGLSSLQLQAFAAPKKSGIWDEIRGEIAEGINNTGGKVDDVPGPLGRELIAHINRGSEVRQARFIGHDGPRWFLRGVITGPAATDPEAAKQLEDLFRDIVVVRDETPKPPRDLLPLSLPGQAQKLAGQPEEAKPNFDPMKRGPEITEIH